MMRKTAKTCPPRLAGIISKLIPDSRVKSVKRDAYEVLDKGDKRLAYVQLDPWQGKVTLRLERHINLKFKLQSIREMREFEWKGNFLAERQF